MLAFGGLGMAYRYDAAGQFVDARMKAWPMLLPATVMLLMLCGIGYQYMKAPTGGGGGSKSSSGSKAKAAPAEKE